MTRVSDGCGVPSTVDQWTAFDGSTLSITIGTGDVTCPDGTHVTIGPNYGTRTELRVLLHPEEYQQCSDNGPVSCPPSFPHF